MRDNKIVLKIITVMRTMLFVLMILKWGGLRAQVEGANMSSAIVMDNGGSQGNIYEFPEGNYLYEHGGDNDFTMNYGDDYGNASPDVFYRFTVLGNTQLQISTCESSFDTYVYLLDANGSELASNDDNGPLCNGSSSSIVKSVPAGTYYIVVESGVNDYHTWGGYYLTVRLNVSPPPPTAGINTWDAIPIGNYATAGTYNYSDSRSNAPQYGYGNDMGQASDDIYYTFTIGNTSNVSISLCGSNFDTYLYLLNGGGAILQSNNDNGPLCSGTRSSLQTANLSPGTYYIVVEGNGNGFGTLNLAVTAVVQSVQNTVVPSNTQNFIYTRTILKDNVFNSGDLQDLSDDDVRSEIQYFDGLGRPLQNIAVQAAPNARDIITPINYDAFGRQEKSYLPYATTVAGTGAYQSNAISNQASFYAAPPTTSIPAISNPFSQTVFETSPLNRPVEVAASGQSWAIGAGHTAESWYEVNASGDNVRLWNVQSNGVMNIGAASSGYYEPGQLYKNVVLDENKNQIIEFRDKEGQIVCKKVQDGGSVGSPTYMITQYIYDDFDQLAYVLPPALENIVSFSETDANFSNYIYAYHYDELLRTVEKKVPAKGWEYIVYNSASRPVYTSDQEQRDRGKWSFVKYDGLGRIIMTGEADIVLGTTRASLQAIVNNALKPVGSAELYETYNGVSGDNNMGYSNNTFPNAGFKIFTVNYYDDYSILSTINPYPAVFTLPNGTPNESLRTKGLPTISGVNILGTTTYLYTATYYTEEKARVSKVVKQHQLNGVDVITNTYNFVGELTASTRQHFNNGNTSTPALTVATANQYDHAGRIAQIQETINSQQPITTTYIYNAVGQLERKSIGGQDIDYKYNARGWVTRQSSALFTQELKYDDASQNPQYNGNIAQQLWTTDGQGHSYNYSYDKANRLLSGTSDENYNETLSYDKMGNIISLYRQGTSAITTGLGTLLYTYDGNQLQTVSGGYNKNYTYNSNGSMIGDGEIIVQYNELGLPRQVSGSKNVNYTYNAAGDKLIRQSITETRYYLDGIEYYTNASYPTPVIDFIRTENGLIRNNSGSYSYEYFLKDNLANTRVVFNNNGLLQQTDYMPFGLEINRYISGSKIKYLYNGIEKNDELGMFEARFRALDPIVARWWQVDPEIENMESWSPYASNYDNPIRFSDPLGNEPEDPDPPSWKTRIWGGVKAVGGVLEMAAGGIGGGATSWTGVGAVAGGLAVVHGADVATAGLKEVWTGRPARTLTEQGVSSGLQAAGVSEQKANTVAAYTDTGVSLVLTAGLGLAANAERVTVYRGVNESHAGYFNATNGKAVPKGGNATAAEHNAGNTNSKFTSWTTNKNVAVNYAKRPSGSGVVLSKTIRKSSLVKSPSAKDVILKQSGKKVNESEVLLKGRIKNAIVERY